VICVDRLAERFLLARNPLQACLPPKEHLPRVECSQHWTCRAGRRDIGAPGTAL